MAGEVTETKVTEFEDGSKIVESVTTESEYVQSEESRAAEAELMDDIEAEAIDEVTDAAVEIARIEAERDITIAAIQAEAETESQEETSWQQNIEARMSSLSEAVDRLTTSLTPPPSEEPHPNNPTLDPEPDASEVMPDSPEMAEQSAPEPPKRPKKSRWI